MEQPRLLLPPRLLPALPLHLGPAGRHPRDEGQREKVTFQISTKLDPVGSTVRYEMMKLCTGSV